ncbi:cupin domain-containing protein [Nitrogeniibacter mangrovi]|uniref:Cupin domain-containing protein n=1 Tax=Nitrogeniibacter mangrovi TaxID=2016596 RepID=A0A6C1B680_9RHOO|nr:cupin domain-containing protein [Nitrogeniibacter mangrovi]QID19201.1 cupin domain-containing protein [Nitrogeniibacter mangrovi]
MHEFKRGSLTDPLPAAAADEHVTPLMHAGGARIERIVSHGQASPPGFWYDQDRDEWVLVVSGRGVLAFADGRRETLEPGDWICLPAGCRHRVEETHSPTVWLAVHLPRADT